MPTLYMTLALILLWIKFSEVLFACLTNKDVQNVLLLFARKPWGTGRILWSIAAVSMLGRSHLVFIDPGVKLIRRLLSRCSAGTTSTFYLKQRLLDVWAEWSKDQWRPNVNDQASKPQRKTCWNSQSYATVATNIRIFLSTE